MDGILEGSGNNTFAADNIAGNYPVRIGCGQQASDFNTYTTVNPIRQFGGSIATLKVYDVAATAAEMLAAYREKGAYITGNIKSGGVNISGATVYYNTVANASVNSVGSVTTDASGNYSLPVLQNTGPWYIAYVNPSATYYLICKKSAHADSIVTSVPVVTSNVSQNFSVTKNSAVKLVDVDAGGLSIGSHTTADTWANSGSLAGTFNPSATYTVASALAAGGHQAISFTNNVRFVSTWLTSAAVWPSAIAGGDVQFSTVAFIYAPATTDTYMDWSTATGAARGSLPVSSSWMRYRYNSADQWGESDHGNGTWMGWLGTNQASQATTPAYATWHMIVNTYDGASEKLYVDNVKVSNSTGDTTLRTFSPVANNMNIGGVVGANSFTGYINKIQVYDQALDLATITSLWNAFNATNYTGANISIIVIPVATITGQVTESGTGTPLAGAMVCVSTTANASVAPSQVVTTDGSGNYLASIVGGTWYFCATDATHKTSADITITNVNGSAQSGKNIALVADSANNVPQKSSLLFSVLSDSLPTTQGADTGNWAVYQPLGAFALTKQNSPTVDVLGGKSFVMNHNASADALKFMNLAQPNTIAMNGATITTVVKPIRAGTVNNYQPVVSVLLGQLELCIRNGDGLLRVGRKGTDASNFSSSYYFADGVEHIVSYVVQPNGYFQVYVDGVSVWNYTAATADMTSITAQTWYATDISIGKGWNRDGWSSFNGDIGDTFVYKTALSSKDRIALESSLAAKFGITTPVYHTLNCTAGTGGTITPSGSEYVQAGSNQTVTITPDIGYGISNVTLDEVSQGAISSIPLTNITADHTIVASFAVVPQHTISGTVTNANGGAPISGATIYISTSQNAAVGTPAYTATTDGSGNWSKVVYEGAYYVCAGATNYYNSADQARNVSADAGSVNFALRSSVRNIPQTGNLLFGAVTESHLTAG